MSDTDMLSYALAYAQKGMKVFPIWEPCGSACTCGDPNCERVGKHPVEILVSHGCLDATTDEPTIKKWWKERPNANIGLAATDALFFGDIDPRHGGDKSLAKLESEHGRIDTLRVRTGGGGEHLYLKPNDTPIKGRIGVLPGIDIKSTGGYVVAPPSVHASGKRYRFESGSKVVSLAPAWFVDVISVNGAKKEPIPTAAAFGNPPEGQRYKTLCSIVGKMRHVDLPEDVALRIASEACGGWTPAVEDKVIADTVGRYYRNYAPGPELPPHPADDEAFREREAIQAESAEPELPGKLWDAAAAAEWPTEPLEWDAEPLIPQKCIGYMSAAPKDRKSLLTLPLVHHHLALLVPTGLLLSRKTHTPQRSHWNIASPPKLRSCFQVAL